MRCARALVPATKIAHFGADCMSSVCCVGPLRTRDVAIHVGQRLVVLRQDDLHRRQDRVSGAGSGAVGLHRVSQGKVTMVPPMACYRHANSKQSP